MAARLTWFRATWYAYDRVKGVSRRVSLRTRDRRVAMQRLIELNRQRARSGRIVVIPDPPQKPRWFVYFIQAEMGGLIKIGTSIDLLKRLTHMQASSPVPLRIIGCIDGDYKVERSIHAEFAVERRHYEWFEPSERLMAFMAERLITAGIAEAEYTAASQMYRNCTETEGPAAIEFVNGNAKLTDEQVAAIRKDHRSGSAIAAHYGISQALVSMIRKQTRRWGSPIRKSRAWPEVSA